MRGTRADADLEQVETADCHGLAAPTSGSDGAGDPRGRTGRPRREGGRALILRARRCGECCGFHGPARSFSDFPAIPRRIDRGPTMKAGLC
ncbi:hypothetical protein [Lysobacter gummosus]|uniref:hypothetical protein n=1 Tax=Lysobacter gummosus TaxID=262324 RepID=UPI003630EDB3